MSKVQMLRVLVNQRLTAAAEEIFVLFERTIAEYEEELCRSKEEKERQRKLLDAVFNPQLQLHRADVQQLLESKEEVPPEQQERSSSPDQEYPEPPHIKKEQEELWTSQEREKLQVLEEADITEFTFTPVPVKTEDGEKLQSSEIHQRQTEQMEPEADGEDCGGSEPARNSHPDRHLLSDTGDKTSDSSETDVSDDDWTESRKPQSQSATLKNNEDPLSDVMCYAVQRSFNYFECGQISEPDRNSHPDIHLQPDTDDNTSNSSETEDSDEWKETSEPQSGLKSMKNNDVLSHISSNINENSFSCFECDQTFSQMGNLMVHQRIHTGEKPFSCPVCDKRFVRKGSIMRHMRIHTGEKPYSCSVCGKAFNQNVSLQQHIRAHSEEKPFSCPFCDKRFAKRSTIRHHVLVHTGEKRFFCSVCDKGFTWNYQLKRHKCVGESSQLHQSQTEENREAEPPASRSAEQMETEADGEDCGGSEPARNSHPDRHLQPVSDDKTSDSSETEDSDELEETSIHDSPQPKTEVSADDQKETREPQSGLNMRQNTGKKAFSCSECDKEFGFKRYLKRHMKIHTVEKLFKCPDCCKRYKKKGYLKRHMRIHSGENI